METTPQLVQEARAKAARLDRRFTLMSRMMEQTAGDGPLGRAMLQEDLQRRIDEPRADLEAMAIGWDATIAAARDELLAARRRNARSTIHRTLSRTFGPTMVARLMEPVDAQLEALATIDEVEMALADRERLGAQAAVQLASSRAEMSRRVEAEYLKRTAGMDLGSAPHLRLTRNRDTLLALIRGALDDDLERLQAPEHDNWWPA